MQRREFCRAAAVGALALAAPPVTFAENDPLSEHRIAAVEFRTVKLPWPRHVGRNATKGDHGNGPTENVCIIETDQGASGWGQLQSSRNDAEDLSADVIGKRVSELFAPQRGILDRAWHPLDIALHDLAGHIFGQPVWKMLAPDRANPFVTKVYSGMIYFDDLDPADHPAGIDVVLKNSEWDVKHGYRQLKVKIGRGHK